MSISGFWPKFIQKCYFYQYLENYERLEVAIKEKVMELGILLDTCSGFFRKLFQFNGFDNISENMTDKRLSPKNDL